MKKSEMIELIAEALLKVYGGDDEEREEVRASTKMYRLKLAVIALDAAEDGGVIPPRSEVDGERWWDEENE